MFLPSNITLKFGDSGDFVSELQRRLATVGAHTEDAVSGFFDGTTVNSVSSFQARNGLRADGIAGPETLRKLNGVISGDTSGGTANNTAEEEAKQLADSQIHATMAMQNPVAEAPAFAPVVEEVVQAVAEMRAPEPVQVLPALTEQQMLQQQIAREAQVHQQNTPSASDMLAQMLAQTAPHQPQPEQHQPAPQQHQPLAQAVSAQPEAAPEQPKGIVGRALQKMDAMLQKMSDYFETKLPPDVIREVKNLGTTMMQNGVKEVPIPTGPDQVRGPTAPARGPEQQPQIQRG